MRRTGMQVGLTLAIAALLASCDGRPDQWDAFVYPDVNDMETFKTIEGFESFEACQSAAIGELRSLPDPDSGDYECGHKCAIDPDLGINVCKETRK